MPDVETLPCTRPPVAGGTHQLTPMRSGNGFVPACRYCGFTAEQLVRMA